MYTEMPKKCQWAGNAGSTNNLTRPRLCGTVCLPFEKRVGENGRDSNRQ